MGLCKDVEGSMKAYRVLGYHPNNGESDLLGGSLDFVSLLSNRGYGADNRVLGTVAFIALRKPFISRFPNQFGTTGSHKVQSREPSNRVGP